MYITKPKFTGLNCTWLLQSSKTNHTDTQEELFCYCTYTSTSKVITQDSFWKLTDATSRMCEVSTLTVEHLDFGSTYIYIKNIKFQHPSRINPPNNPKLVAGRAVRLHSLHAEYRKQSGVVGLLFWFVDVVVFWGFFPIISTNF